MIQNETTRVWVNRIFAFLVGGLLLFLIMNFSVADKLRKELDASRYEASRLLNDAKADIENKRYDRAKQSLDMLAEKHPGSSEAVEGNKLYAVITTSVQTDQITQTASDLKWKDAVEGVRTDWETKTAAEMRDKITKQSDQLEKDMNNILAAEWEKNKEKIREEWEKLHGKA
jgi:hypothetical protein